MDDFIEQLRISKLTDEERDRIKGPLSYPECKEALDTFQTNKTPGEDGFTVEFYRFFFDLLGHDLVQPTRQTNLLFYNEGELSL